MENEIHYAYNCVEYRLLVNGAKLLKGTDGDIEIITENGSCEFSFAD